MKNKTFKKVKTRIKHLEDEVCINQEDIIDIENCIESQEKGLNLSFFLNAITTVYILFKEGFFEWLGVL